MKTKRRKKKVKTKIKRYKPNRPVVSFRVDEKMKLAIEADGVYLPDFIEQKLVEYFTLKGVDVL